MIAWMRSNDAAPRWNRLVTQPIAIMGHVSMPTYDMNMTNVPTVMRPSMAC